MEADAVREIVGQTKVPVTVQVHPEGSNRIFVPPGWSEPKPFVPSVEPIRLSTLKGFVALVKAATKTEELYIDLLVHVVDPRTVRLIAPVETEVKLYRRNVLAISETYAAWEPATSGRFMDAEQFTITLQTAFVQTPDRDKLLALIGTIREGSVRETVDDGVAQEVKTRKGVALVENQKVPNPILLQPYRTFREIEQPASPFLLRLRDNPGGEKPLLALFEADGGIWRIEAVSRIAEYLRVEIGTLVAAIIE